MRAGIYTRISQDTEGGELGVRRQEEDCRREAVRRSWEVVDVYADNDVSATRSKVRKQYQRMLADVQEGRINAVIVWSVDRLTRTPRELEDVIDLANQFGVEFANVGGTINLSSPEGRAMARQMGTFARLEVENMSKRLKRKFQQRAEAGEPHGFSPYGFTRETVVDEVTGAKVKRDVPNPDQAALVAEGARRVLERESLRSIVADWNERSIPGPKADRWNTTILRQILLRPTNAGLRQYQGKVIGTSTSKPILGRDTFDQLVALLTDPSRKQNHVGPAHKYLLGGIARCGACGARMRRLVGRAETKRTGVTHRQPPAYGCPECFKVRRSQERVDAYVVEVLVRRLSEPDATSALIYADGTAAQEAQVEIERLDAKLAVTADMFVADEITADQLKRTTADLREKRRQSEAQLRSAQPSRVVEALIGDDVRTRWDAMALDAKREVIDSLMAITVLPAGPGRPFNPDDIRIEWKTN